MIYVVVKQSPMYHQMSLEELLFGEASKYNGMLNSNISNTRTYALTHLSDMYRKLYDIRKLIMKLEDFNRSWDSLRKVPRHSLYREFVIPKKSGGLRPIKAPEPALMTALRELKMILEEDFGALYHTSAFAYIRKRSTVDAVKRHQANESKWFAKYDLSNFFGSTTLEFVMRMFSMIFPFSEVIRWRSGREALESALELGFLDGGLPQGTPLSPIITNIMMIPIDYKLCNGFRNFKYTLKGEEKESYCVYTRYADDFTISSKYDFSYKQAEQYIIDTLKSFDAPFSINEKKTRYGSSAGRNFNLGLMLNKDNEITIGHKKKKQFTAMLSSYAMDKKNGIQWDIGDVQTMDGYRNYYRMVEKERIDGLIQHLCNKFGMDIVAEIKKDLKKV